MNNKWLAGCAFIKLMRIKTEFKSIGYQLFVKFTQVLPAYSQKVIELLFI